MSVRPNIVLVHGAWADGSSWSAVIERLQADGYSNVTAPQFPESSLAADVARLRQVLARQDGPTIVAGHSYGGQIVTALGTDAPNVVGLVYVAAFGLDEGESIGGLLAQGPPTPALAHLDIDEQGFAWLPEDDFVNHFATDVDPVSEEFLERGVEPGDLCGQLVMAAGHTGHRSPSAVGRAAGPESSRRLRLPGRRQPRQLLPRRLGRGHDQVAHLVAGLGAGLDRTAPGHPQHPDRLG
jgi:pimeloyl-ACP methyl ester carboxylesterase